MTPGEDTGKLVIRRRMLATREELFDEWTNPESMRVWMCAGNMVSAEIVLDLRVGGAVSITMRSPTAVHEHTGEFTIIDRPAKLAFTWITKSTDMLPTLVTVEFLEISATESELVLTHEKFSRQDVRDDHRRGWGQIVDALEQYLRTKYGGAKRI
jgi:uncharacterized protein YndB with AHSA1/START domain